MMTRLTMPSVKGSRSILAGSLPATQAAVPSATAAALPQVTMPHSAPVNSAMRRPAASISSSRLTNWRDAASIAARTCGSIRLPPCIVRTLQQLMNGRTPRARYGLVVMPPPLTIDETIAGVRALLGRVLGIAAIALLVFLPAPGWAADSKLPPAPGTPLNDQLFPLGQRHF